MVIDNRYVIEIIIHWGCRDDSVVKLLLQRTGVQFPAPICWLTMSCNSVSRSDFHEYVHIQTIHTCMQTEHLYMSNKKILKKNHAYIMFFLVWRFCYSTVFFFFYDKSFSCLHLSVPIIHYLRNSSIEVSENAAKWQSSLPSILKALDSNSSTERNCFMANQFMWSRLSSNWDSLR